MFVTRIRAAAGDDRSPWGDFWFEPVGVRGSSGARVNADTAMRLSAVYACVRVLTESFAVLPFKLYRPRASGKGRALVIDHWLYGLLTRRPNRFQTAFEWREMLQGHVVLRGNAFCEIVDDGKGGIAELLPKHPDRIKVDMLGNGSWRYVYSNLDGSQTIFRRDQLWHLRGLSSDGVLGLNPIELQREAISAGMSAQEYGNRFFANDAKPSGGWIEYPGKFSDNAAKQTFGASLQRALSGANRHKTMVLEQGMKYHEVGMSNKDSQFLEARGFTRTEIAGMFRVAPHMIGDLSRATFSNIEQQSIDHWMTTMLPWCERWESSLEALVADDGLEVEFDFRNLMRGDAASRATYSHMGVLDGWLTRNEARELEGYDPIDGLDEPLVPVNERGLDDPDPAGEAGAGEDKPDAVQTPTPDEEGADASRLAVLLRGNAARMARRIAAGDPPSNDVLAEALAITPHDAGQLLEALGVAGKRPAATVADDLVAAATANKGRLS